VNRLTVVSLAKLVAFILVTVATTGVLASTIGTVNTAGGAGYTARFVDVTGLQVGDDVRVAGVEVGKVTQLKIVQRQLAEVSFSVKDVVRLRETSTVNVRYRNLIGQRYLAVSEGSPIDPLMHPGETIPVERTTKALDLSTLLGGFKPLFRALSPADVNKLSYEIIRTLQGEGGTVNSLLAHTASLTSTIADKDRVIGRVVSNLDAVLATVSERDSQLVELINQLQRLVSGLAADRGAIRSSLQGIDDLATATVGFLQPVRKPLQQTIAKLGTLATQLDNTKGILDKELKILPRKLNVVLRTAEYGGWFNFYLCAGEGTIYLPGGQKIDFKDVVKTAGAACEGS
jgi:phospholipid/cholesterol/gamma-HCH transport system substrate-binding protein